ncbi:hypothetical protein LINGRAHAP2_LOCUS26915 [Linum grandiflorum]
MGSTSLPRLP